MPRISIRFLVFVVGLVAAVPGRSQDLDTARRLHVEGRASEALEAYRAVRDAVDVDTRSAAIAHNNACVLLIDLGAYPDALDECTAALPLRRQVGETRGVARTLNNLGLALRHVGRYDEATDATREALELNRERADDEGVAVNLSNLAAIALLAGRYGDALAHVTAVVRLADARPDAPWAATQRALAQINRGVVLERLGAYEQALDVYRQLLAADDDLPARHRATLRVNAATLYRNLEDAPRAAELLRDAITQWQALGDQAALANANLNLALVLHRNLVRPADAEPIYRRALALADASGDETEGMAIRVHLGDLLTAEGRFDEATTILDECLRQAERAGSARGQWSALDGLARIDAARQEDGPAIDRLRRAIGLIEGIRAGVEAQDLRGRYLRTQRQVYGRAIGLLANRTTPNDDAASPSVREAFGLTQAAKVRELATVLGAPEQAGTPAQLPAIQARLDEARVLAFVEADGRLLRFTIGPRRVRLDDLGPNAPIRDAVVALHRDLEAGATIERTRLDPLERLLPTDDLTGLRRLYVAPDGPLHYFPFELLLHHRWPKTAPAVVYLPSASALLRPPRTAERIEGGLVAFGDPSLDASPSRAGSATAVEVLSQQFALPPLPQAANEVRQAATAIGGDHELALGLDATETAFRRLAPTARILHLATHAVVDERGDGRAAVLLRPDERHDGLLRPDEIASLALRADLTVLAACRTALGTEEQARGLTSLTGSFLAAGSWSVLATLWDVGDQASAVFMTQLYHQLGRGLPPAEAVARVKKRLRDDPRWSRPDQWAAFVLIGDGPAVAPTSRTRGIVLGLSGFAGLLALLVLVRRRTRPTAG